jgi:peptidoglycan/xylan/chitin deacetylase (PgdA/CDA1 family)
MSSLAGQSLDVLMYHSISDGIGPTSIAPDTFRMQLELLADLDYRSVSLPDVAAWLDGRRTLPERPVLITFDDGFRDFAQVAWPLLQQHGLGAVVFLPTGHVGAYDDWQAAAGHTADLAAAGKRSGCPLMSWEEVVCLGGEGVEFGGHTVHHCDLTRLTMAGVKEEVNACQQALQSHLGKEVLAFAPPYGRSTPAVRAVIAQSYQLSFGTLLGRATSQSDRWDLPRIEMHYFRRPDRWRSHLTGGGRWWLAARRSLRAVRRIAYERLGTHRFASTEFFSSEFPQPSRVQP